ncbi:Acyl-CoA dehydrogenase [Mycena indigotica]|uniref:Acyl-CoA dehydrogenase n=1 Tax=Mycena indigotica TaxID=2126181 RepID=A0A8H6T1T5_9AGAR|nr:Acyl-CoA dehydrogenase [Mycena indigotica]KAF7310093.1 Acyl-CoA dehydrogenase [Mycena indigotica]
MTSKQYTKEEVAKHNKKGDLWIVIDGRVFDLSRFAAMHPGGLSVLLDEEVAGQDATEAFFGLHRQEILLRPQYARLQIGTVVGETPQIVARAPGELSSVPYAEPTWLTKGYHSPYFGDKHRAFQAAVRKLLEEVVLPDALAREEDGKPVSQAVWDKLAEANIMAMRFGAGPHLQGRTLLGGIIKPEEMTTLYSLILNQEFARFNARGYADGGNGSLIGLPPILKYGKPALRDKIMNEFFDGKKFVSLAISEAFAGSDVSGMKTFAKKTDAGWLVTGTKKWITGGMVASYFTVGCRSEKGMVVLVIERGPGVETKPIKTAYSSAAGTAFVTFDNVLVPFENQLGQDGKGLHVILANFNDERWGMTAAAIASHRVVVEECLKWATQRKVFGKPLVSQAVIRSKLAAMISRVESAQAWIENITYQMANMNHQEQAILLAGQIALLKSYATKTAQETAEDAVQIFGGRGITRTGMGRHIEHYHRTVVFDAILGGTEDVLEDLGVRQALRAMPKNARL